MRWTPIETLALPDHSVSAVAGDALGGDKAGLFSFGTQTDRGLRGFYYDPTGGPLPVVVSSSLLAATGRRPGEAFNARIADRWLQVVIEGTVDYFPTADPLSGGFILADLESLLGHHNVLAESYSARPNEAFIRSSEAGHVSAREGLAALLGRHGSVQDVAGQLRSLSLDPFVSAGWKPMQFLAPAIGGLAAAVGYVTYLLLFTKRSWHDMGFLHVIGLSRHQLRGLLGFQHLSMAAVGVGLGTWAGSYMSRLLVSPLAVTETGLPVGPTVRYLHGLGRNDCNLCGLDAGLPGGPIRPESGRSRYEAAYAERIRRDIALRWAFAGAGDSFSEESRLRDDEESGAGLSFRRMHEINTK